MRHGRTAWNAAHRFLGQTDVPLDAVGRVQARRRSVDRAVLGPTRRVSSPLRRARETAAYLGGPAEPVVGLEELHQGQLEGLDVATAVARWPAFFRAWSDDPTQVPVPGGESLGACRDRALAALTAVARDTDGGRLVVVTHQMVIASVTATVVEGHLLGWRTWAVAPTGVRRLRYDGAWHLLPVQA